MMITMIKIKGTKLTNSPTFPSPRSDWVTSPNRPVWELPFYLNDIVQQAAQLRFPSGAMPLGDQQCHFPSCDRHRQIKIIPWRKEDSGRLLLAPTYPRSHARDMVQLDTKLASQLPPDAQQCMAFRTGRTPHEPLLDLEGAAA